MASHPEAPVRRVEADSARGRPGRAEGDIVDADQRVGERLEPDLQGRRTEIREACRGESGPSVLETRSGLGVAREHTDAGLPDRVAGAEDVPPVLVIEPQSVP